MDRMMDSEQNNSSALDRLMPLTEVAKAIGRSVREVWREIGRGRLPRPVRGRPARLFESDVRKYLDLLRQERNKMSPSGNGVVA
jgi:predicted DNA-binding transcriptional regulator AlpA